MKRIFLFVATNLAVVLVMSVLLSLLGVGPYLENNGLNIQGLMIFSLVLGFAGAFVSLLISKPMAKWSTGAQVIESPRNSTEQWLLSTVATLAKRAEITMPEVAVFEGAPNAFATGAFKNSSLVAVSTGLLTTMTRDEVEAVLAHEVAHIANGDMVTMTLIQGVMNTFVIFLSRVVGFVVDRMIFQNDEGEGSGMGYFVTVIISQIFFGILASIIVAWFSRQREYRADAGATQLMGNKVPMIQALARLGGVQAGALPKSLAAAGISDGPSFAALFSSHPPIEDRIAKLQESN